MMLFGHCCHCAGIVDPPTNNCTAEFKRIAYADATPVASVPDFLPQHDPGLSWVMTQGVAIIWPTSDRYWFCDLNESVQNTGAGLKTILMPPMRYRMDYPAGNNTDWRRGKWIGGFQNDGGIWPRAVTDSGMPSNSSMHAVNGAFAKTSHITTGQFINKDNRLFQISDLNENTTGGQFRCRIRYMRLILDGIPQAYATDVIPSQYEFDWLSGGSPQFEGFPSIIMGDWNFDLPIRFTGGQMEWDIWYEVQINFAGSGVNYIIQDEHPVLTYTLEVFPDWDPSTEDWSLTFTGGDSPSSPDNTKKFSDMDNVTISSCYCQGEFTWPAPFDEMTLQCTFRWDREVCAILLENIDATEGVGPYNSASETYLSEKGATGSPSGVQAIERWYDASTDEYFKGQTDRGFWDGTNTFFPQAVNAQFQAGSYPANRLTGVWPTGVAIVRTTQ